MSLQAFRGSCHCGAVQFRFQSPPIVSGWRCNCSLCRRGPAVMSTRQLAPEDFELLQGEEALSLYRFGTRGVGQRFCKHCGIYVFHDDAAHPGHFRVNLGCVEGVDLLTLPVSIIDLA